MRTFISKKLWAVLLPLAFCLAPAGAADRVVRVTPMSVARGESNQVFVVLQALGNENAVGLSLCYDTNHLAFVKAVRTTEATNAGASLNLNVTDTSRGRVGMGMAIPPDTAFPAGSNPIIEVTFRALAVGPSVATSVSLCDLPIGREVVDLGGRDLGATYEDGVVNILGSCAYALATNAVSISGAGGSGAVGVTAATGCAWSVVNTNEWITMTSGLNGSGNGTVSFAVAANPGALPRAGVLTIAGLLYTVNQAAFACSYSIAPTNRMHGYGAATNSVTVTADAGCGWSVINTNAWVTITSGANGTGDGSVAYVLQANPSLDARTGTLTIAGRTFTLVQSGFVCTYKISPTNRVHGAAAATNTVSVTTSNGCTWTVENTNAWIAILAGASGTGTGTVSYAVEANPNPVVRTGLVLIANQVLTLSQDAVVCTYKLSPTNRNQGYTAATNTVSLTTSSGCAWTVVNTNGWITITSAASGLGNATVSFTITTNPDTTGRTGAVSVADQIFTVSQAGAPCSYAISPTNGLHGVGGTTGLVNVTAGSGCAWTVNNTNSWITINSGASGVGNGSVGYSVAANSGSARSGVVTIAGLAYSVSQSGVTVCTYKISPTNRVHGAAAATNTVSVTTSNGCTWSVENTNAWIAILAGASGPGTGVVRYAVEANPNPVVRTGLVLIANQVLTLSQDAVVCTYRLSPTNRNQGYTAATNTVSLTTSSGCAWTVVNTNQWITITSAASGLGNATVGFTITTNPDTTGRTGTVSVADQIFTVSQAGAPCSYAISPTNGVHGAGADTGLVNVTAGSGCAWTVNNTNSWITINSGSSGVGNGSVGYSVAANTGSARSGVLTIAGLAYPVSQSGVTVCTYKISPTNRVHGAAAATNTVSVTTSNGCTWTVENTNAWITILAGASGAGTGTVSYAVEANPNPVVRTGLVLIANQVLTLSQDAVVCTYKLSPTNRNQGYTAATNTVSLTTSSGCAWTVVNTNGWITITSAASGLGNATVSFTITTNPDTTGRTGAVSVADQIFTVSQAGAPCSYAISPTNGVHGAGADTGLVNVTAGSGCAWTVNNTNSWITINSGSSGVGNGSVGYSVAANTGSGRSGVLTIAGLAYPVSQSGVTVCTYKISPTNRVHGSGAASNSVSVTTSNGCTWSVVNTNDWVTILSGASGTGTGSVNYAVAANPSFVERTGLVIIAGQALTLIQHAATCEYSLSPTNRTHGYSAATNSVDLTAGSGCVWTVINTNGWIDITSPTSGMGSATVSYTIDENPTAVQRTGLVMIADKIFALTQRAAPCLFELTPTNRLHGSGSEIGLVSVNTSASCEWQVVNTNSWINILVGSVGIGPGEITYGVSANPGGAARTGVITVGDQRFLVVQQGVGCSYAVAPANRVHGAGSETGQVSVTTLAGCPWTVENTNNWIDTVSSGSGSATVTYSVDPNPSLSPRTGALVIAGETFTVTQVGFTCAYKLSPTNRTHGNGSVTGLVSVTTSNGCAWTVVNTNEWIIITAGASGDGSGGVAYAVDANPTSSDRTGVLQIGGQSFVLTQRGAPCTLTLSPETRNHGYGAATGTVNVTTIIGCAWSVENTNVWISILLGAGGSGNGSFTYAITDNPGMTVRTGVVVVADQTLTLVQSGAPCTFSLSASARTHGYAPATNSVSLTTMNGCPWTVTNTNNWITITTATAGSGSATIGYVIAANPDTLDRIGSVLIADKVLTLTQRAAPCAYELAPTNRLHGFAAGTGLVNVTTSSNCLWSVTNTNEWITIDFGASGTGNGTVGYSVSANPSPVARVGLLEIGGERFRVNQAGVPCDYEITPTNRLHGAGSETGLVHVVTSNACPWNVVNTNQWITIVAGASGAGNGDVTYVTAANPAMIPRHAELTIAGETFTLSQEAAACTYKLSPTNRTHGYGAATGTVSVAAMNGCTWSVDNTNNWITILEGTSGVGTGSVTYAVSANPVIVARTGVVTIAEQSFMVSQLAAPCTFSISPTRRTHGFGSTNNSINLTTLAGCAWTVINTNEWITITSSTSGTGSATISYVVVSNLVTIERTGLVMIADEVFTLTQRAAPCVYELTPTNGVHGHGAGTGLVAVATSGNCSWTAETTNDWITIAPGTGGTGNGNVGYVVAANPTGVPREGAVLIGGTTYPVSQAGAPCVYELLPTSRLHGTGVETGVVTVVTLEGCGWNIVNLNDWITILSSTNGPGERSVTYAVSANPGATMRSGEMTIAGHVFTVNQVGLSCAYVISPTQHLHGATSETGTVGVTTASGCAWSVVNTNTWVLLTSGDSGTNSGSVFYTVTANPSSIARSGTLLIAGESYFISQAGAACTYAITPTNRVHGGIAATGTVSVISPGGCPWSVSNTNGWVTILAGGTGAGTGTVTYAVEANPSSIPRSGTLLIAGVPFTVGQAGATCVYAIAPTNVSHGAGSATGLVAVTTLAGCSWDATSAASWITITSGANGTGSGTVGYNVAANPTLAPRSGVVTIAGQSLVVTQAAAVCTFTINPTNAAHGSGLGTGVVSVTTLSACGWTTTNTNNWITIVSGANGAGTGSVTYTVATNPTAAARSGVLTIAGQVFTVSQAGAVCNFALTPSSRSHGAAIETGSVSVATISGCPWTAGASQSWIIILSGASGVGGGTVSYMVAENPDITARTGTVSVADQVFTVSQAGVPCTFALSPPGWIHRSGLETGMVSVTTHSGCGWTVNNTNSWLAITSGTNGVGSGSVSYTVAANAGGSARAGVVTIGGQPFAVSQGGSTCTFKISPTNRLHGFGAVTNSVAVTTSNGCSWTVVNTNDWVSILSGASGTGTGIVNYAVTKNANPNPRLGLVNIAGEWLILTQWGTNCAFSLAPISRSHSYASETGLVVVTASSTNCTWSVANSNSWITIASGGSGTGNGSVGYAVATNANSSPRTGVFTVSGELFTVNQAGAPCLFAITPASRSHGAGLETGLVSVTVVAGCVWSVGNTNDWITVTAGAAGTGAGSFGYSVAANPTAFGRTGVVSIADQTLTLIQAGAACTYGLAPTNPVHGAGSSTGLVTVTAIPGCGWTVNNTNSWITINSGATGTGNGSVGYTVAANPAGTPRTGLVTIGGQLLTVSQAGAECTFAILPTSRAHGSGVETGSVAVTTISGCSWTVENTNAWIQITSGSAGTGSGTVGYSVLTNPSLSPRTGSLRIGGQIFMVTQAGLTCAYALTPSSRSHGIGSETGTISVTTSNVCAWTVVNPNSWITINSGASGTGDGTVNYTVVANTGAMRSGTLFVAGLPFTVTQSGMVRMIRAVDMSIPRGQTNVLLVVLESKGDENALGFSLGFDTNLLTFLKAVRGSDATNASVQLNVNTNQVAANGRIGFGLGLPAGVPFPSGDRTILEVHFRAAAGTTFATTSVTNSDRPIVREVVDVNADELITSYKDAAVAILGDCAYALGASGASFGDTGGPGSVSVTANSACAWTVVNSNNWISITSGTNGMGNSSVSFLVAANASPNARTGVLTIAGQPFTVSQSGIVCTYGIAPTTRLHGAGSETGLVVVTVASGCPWTVNNTNGWIAITTSTNGSGNGSFGYSIQANPSIVARTGLVQVAGQVFSVSQTGAPCTFGLVPTNRSHGYGVETGLVTVTTPTGCSWTVVNTNPWVTITSGASGVGNGSVGYTVGINPSLTARAGVLVIGGQSFLVSQAGNICAYSVAPTGRTHGYSSETGTVAVVSGSGCPWTVVNTNSWITINSGASGTGNGGINYTVSFNSSGTARTGVLVVGGQPFTVTQAGSPCAYAIAPSDRNHGAGIESGTISLATFGGCSWTATTTNSWVAITAGASGTGSGSVSYSVAANGGGPSRTGLVLIAELPFTIVQVGQPCTFSLSSSNRSHGFAAEIGTVALTAVAGCPWTVVNSNTWITITSGSGGASSTNVTYAVASNPAGIARTGVVTIADQLLTVTQAGAPCIITLSPTNRVHGYGATTGTVSVTTLVGCGWSASTTTPWITILSGANGIGTGSVSYALSDNLNAAGRTGVVSIAGQTVTLTQSGAPCTYAVSPTNRVHGEGVAFGSLSVTTITGCTWTVSNTNPWISILTATNATGSGTVDYQVGANLSAFARTGLVVVAGQIVTLIQSGTPCSYSLFPVSRLHTAAMETGTVTVTTINGCPWTVSNPNSWITIASGGSGASNGVVTYVVNANVLSSLRSGVLTIGGQSFTVNQEGLPCRYQLNPTFSVLTSGNVTGLVSVIASNGCGWVVENTNAWIAIKSGESGTNNGLVRYTAAPNPNPSSRTGNLVIGGEIFPVTQLGAPCSYQLSATNRTLGSGSETGMVSVFTSPECSWTTVNTNAWITITSGTNGSGNATVGYALSPNPTAGDRIGVITIGGANGTVNYIVTQFGSSCSYALTPQNRLHGPGLETGMVFVTSVTGCTWTVTKTNTWITITSGLSGTNDGVVNYIVSLNASPTQRSGVLVIGGIGGSGARSFVVTQDGVLCEYAISPTNGVHGFGAGTGVVSVATSNVCPWTVSNTNSWIVITSGTNGIGNTNVTYTFPLNPSPSPRTGSLTIAGQPYTVTQAGIPCTYALTPTGRSHDYAAGTGVVAVATSNLCTWTVSNSNSWITITSPTNHTSSGTVGYAVAANMGTSARAGVVNIAGQPFTVNQFGIPFSSPSNRTVECSTPWNFEPPTLSGTCSNLNMTLIVLSSVTNVVCGNALNATRTWDATDGCGNHLVLTQMVKVVVTAPPLMICGTNKIIECGLTWGFDPPMVTDGCGGTNVSIRVVSTLTNKVGACGNTFVAIRTWEAADACTNKATCVQIVSVLDRTPPLLVCASNRVVECGTAWNFTAPTASDVCGTNVTLQIVSTVTNTVGFCGATYSATRTWEATDSCSNRTSCSQTVTVVDTTPPTLTCSPNKLVDCGTAWSFDSPSVVDNCGGPSVSVVIVSTSTNTTDFCGGTYSATRIWEATDSCSNKSTCAQTVRIVDGTVPVLVCQANKVVEYGLNWSFDLPTVSESCSSTSTTLRVVATVTNTAGLCGNTFNVTRFWEATDACTNRSSLCSQTVRVVDTTPPVVTCPSNKVVRCNLAWTFDAPTAFDLASGTNVTITVLSTVTNGTCGNGLTVTRTWQVADNCTNKSTCTQVVTGVNQISLGGTLSYATNYPMAGPSDRRLGTVAMSLIGDTNMVTQTDSGGAYGFTVNAGGNCVLSPNLTNSNPVANGVSTLDISLIRRHILNIALLDSPYKLLAADVNGSRTVSTLDLTFIRRMILTPTNPLPSGLWRFVPSDYVFPNAQSPWDAPTSRSYANLSGDLNGQDFLAIKMGDVNNSWTPPVAPPDFGPAGAKVARASGPDVFFQVSRHTNQPGDTVVTKVTARGLREVTSAQWTLAWDPAVLRFKTTADYGLRGLAVGNFGTALAGAGKLTFSWDDPDAIGITEADGATIFSVSFDVIGDAGTTSPVALVDSATEREVGVKFAPASLRSQDGQVVVAGTATPTSPQLKQPVYIQGTFGVPLATVSGKLYILEYTDALPSTNWIALPPVAGDGTVKTLSDPAPNTRQRFYRVRIE